MLCMLIFYFISVSYVLYLLLTKANVITFFDMRHIYFLKFNLKMQQFFSRERGRSPFPLDGKFCTFVAPKFPNKKVTKWHK